MQLFCSPLICGQVSHNRHSLELVHLSAGLEIICLAERVAFLVRRLLVQFKFDRISLCPLPEGFHEVWKIPLSPIVIRPYQVAPDSL